MIRFGAWSTLLAVLAVQMLALSALILAAPANRLANRYLALLLLVLAGMMTPFVIGYAGFYDAYPWLTAAPFAIPLAVGPLVFAHVHALSSGGKARLIHFAAPALQFIYQAVLFAFPVVDKFWWDENVHVPWLDVPFALAVLASMSGYAIASWRVLSRYRSWLAERRRDPRPARRLALALGFLAFLLVVRSAHDLFAALIRPIDYFDLFGFYVLLGTTGIMIGLSGWRHAANPVPAASDPPERDWAAQGAVWLDRLREADWWRDPELDLPSLARLLGTNTSHLSRALNAGHDGFAAALAKVRAEAVADAIQAGVRIDLLALGLACGFGSKASFNRGFRARYGMSPSAYRLERQRLSA